MHFKVFSYIILADHGSTSDFWLGIQLTGSQAARFFPWDTGVYPGLFKDRRIVQQSRFTPYPRFLPPLRWQGTVAKQKAPSNNEKARNLRAAGETEMPYV